jgi:hypothetical protein
MASTAEEFAVRTQELINQATAPSIRQARQAFARSQSWHARASQFLTILDHPAATEPRLPASTLP